MSPGTETSRENLTLTDAELAACQPVAGEGGHVLRALCPFHGSDHQRSLRVTLASGRFVCFACGAWGYLAEARARWQAEQQRQRAPWRPAQQCGVGYATPGTWPHAARDWRGGRVVFPHTTPDGRLVNLYGRAVGTDAEVPKAKRHDHLPGEKGYFNAAALHAGAGPLWVCEGAFDALALRAARRAARGGALGRTGLALGVGARCA